MRTKKAQHRGMGPWGRFGRATALAVALVAGGGTALQAQDSEVILQVEVKGNQKIQVDTVLYKAGLKVGDDLRQVDLTAVLERLWATGAFDDVKFEVEDTKDEKDGREGKKLIIIVVERPIIKDVDYRGGTEVGLSSLKDKIKEKKLTVATEAPYDPEVARKMKTVIVEQCAEKGFRMPIVDVQLEPMGPGIARLVFDIKEGGKARIYHVAFRGNKVIASGKLRGLMEKTRQHWMFSWLTSHDLLVDKNLEEDLQNIRKEYWKLGYKDVFVGQPTIDIQDRTTPKQKKKNEKRLAEGKSPKYDIRVDLTVPILEGDRYYMGKFKVEGNSKVFKGETGEAFYKSKLGEAQRDNQHAIAKFFGMGGTYKEPGPGVKIPFDLDALNQAIDKIKEAHSNLAYIMFRAEKKFEVREEDGVKKVDVTLKVDEGEQHTVRRISFEGNVTTKDKVLRRALLIREGDPFRLEMFKDSFTGLGQLGFFDVKSNEPRVEPVPGKPQVDITIKGEESGVHELLFQGGYGSLFGFSLGASFSTKNLGGGGETLGVSYNGGSFQKSATISFSEPYLLDLPYSLSASITNQSTNYDASRVGAANAYQQFTKGIGVSLGTRLATFLKGAGSWAYWTTYGVGYNFRIVRIEGGRNITFRDTSAQLTSTFNQSLTYSTVNHPFKPTNGTKLGFSFEFGGWQFGSDKPFFRATWEASRFASLGERHVFAVNASYGYLRNLSNDQLPLWDLYRPGGENSIRGYRYGQVGSTVLDQNSQKVVVGGNKQALLNLEYQFKIADQFRVVLFHDMGNAWAQGTKIFSEALRRSYGVEARFFLPISPAPLRLIWSHKVNPYDFDQEGRNDFQFSIGTTF